MVLGTFIINNKNKQNRLAIPGFNIFLILMKHYLTYLFIAVVCIWTTSNINLSGDKYWKDVLKYDSRGYYAHLPAVFIFHDLHFGFLDEMDKVKYRGSHYYDYRHEVEGGIVNKYYCGTAVMQIPFFAIGHVHAKLSSHDADGFSKPYIFWLNMGSVFYLLIGLFFFEKILEGYRISKKNIRVTLLSLTFGTNAYLYYALDPGMSHVFSFFLMTWFAYVLFRSEGNPTRREIVGLGFMLGMIILVRPVNAIVVTALPFLMGDKEKKFLFFKTLWKEKGFSVLALFTMFAVISIQLILYKLQTGRFFVYSYGEAGFDFLNPHILDFLFSYRKGYFLYTPLALLSLSGLYYMKRFSALALTAFLSFTIYILSSWYMWYYGGSFSSRVMFDYAIFVFIPLAFLLENTKGGKYKILFSLIFLLVVVFQIQLYQYRHFDIHWADMTKEMYWDNFLRIDKYFK